MTDITKVKEIRERSGAGMADCGKALDEAGGDIEKALEVLQKRGILRAEAKATHIASDGLVHTYVHGNGRLAVLVEVNCSTDFCARSPEFITFCDETAMQIAATNPRWVREEEVPPQSVMKQREIFEAQLVADNKPEKAWAKIIEGKLKKWYSEVCLLNQDSVVHEKKTIEDLRVALVAKLGENVNIRRFVRWEVGEGIQKRKEDYLAEVARLTSGSP